ncbi:MAG: hypothetical protein ACYTF1_23055 [Planctomycetota bacterium]|jgi:hypothetical protein
MLRTDIFRFIIVPFTSMMLVMCLAGEAWSDTAVFQQGLSGYNGTVDTFLKQATPASSFGSSSIVEWDGEDAGGQNFGLLRFDNIFGSGPGQIPAGSIIIDATLAYNVGNPGDVAYRKHGLGPGGSKLCIHYG